MPVKLTDKAVERMAAGTARKDVMDARVKGLQLRITKKGEKTWSVIFTVAGKGEDGKRGPNRRMFLGRYPDVKLKDARQKAKDVLAIADDGEDPVAAQKVSVQTKSELEFEAVCSDFIALHAKLKVKSWDRTKRVLETYVVPEWKGRQLDKITRASAHALLDQLQKTHPKTVPIEVRKQLSKLFNWAVDRDKLPANPMAGMQRPEQRYIPRERVLTMEELKRIWAASDALGSPFDAFVRLLILTAQRRVEIASLQRSWIRGDAFEIPPSHYKTTRSQVVPLSKPAAKIVAELPVWNNGDYLITTTGGERPFSGYSKVKARLDERCGVEHWTYHDLRRSAASHMASLGVPPEHVERVLGHAVGGVAGVYNHYSYLKEKRAALELWGQQWN